MEKIMMRKKTSEKAVSDNTYRTDIVIVGGGLSGLSAALTAAENGLKAVLLEKMPFVGLAKFAITDDPAIFEEPPEGNQMDFFSQFFGAENHEAEVDQYDNTED